MLLTGHKMCNNSRIFIGSFDFFNFVFKRKFQQMFSHTTSTSLPTRVIPGFLTPVLYTPDIPSNWLLFHSVCKPIGRRHILLVKVSFLIVGKNVGGA